MTEALTDIHPVLPGSPAPDLTVTLIDGSTWRLHDRTPRRLLLIYVYRGYHCGLCKKALEQWKPRLGELENKGVELLCVSADTAERAAKSHNEWDIDGVPLGYGWDLHQARRWGLYVSEKIKDSEPDLFLEPGFFILNPDFEIHSHAVQSMPNARAEVSQIVEAIDYVLENDYPPRGKVGMIEDRSGDADLSDAAGG